MKTTTLTASPQTTAHGEYMPLYFDSGIRYDRYTAKVTGETATEAVLAIDNSDLSHVKTGRATVQERENCHCCFAGYAHTVNLCNSRQNNK